MAGVLPQSNATLLAVYQAQVLGDSFSEPAGSGEGEELTAKWTGSTGAWLPPPARRKESSTDGRDELLERRVFIPIVCPVDIGDKIEIDYQGQEELLLVSGVIRIGEGVELGAAQTYELQIERS